MVTRKLEDVLAHIGQWGRYQKRVFFLICLYAIPTGLTAISWVFIGAIPKHRCFLPLVDKPEHVAFNISDAVFQANIPFELDTDRVTVAAADQWQRSQCLRYDPPLLSTLVPDQNNATVISRMQKCSAFVYDDSVYTGMTVATEFNLVCDNAWQHSMVQSLYMTGVLVGSLVTGELADRVGRKPALALCTIFASLFGILNYFSWSFWFFALTRSCIGFCMTGFYIISVVLGMELIGPEKRIFAGMMISACFAVGEMLMGALAYFVRDWRLLQLIIAVPLLFYFVVLYFIPESVRWLYVKRRYEEAELILEQIAYKNRVVLDHQWLQDLRQSHDAAEFDSIDDVSAPQQGNGNRCSRFELFKHSNIRKRFAVQLLCWFVASMVYYGLSMETQSLGGNDFIDSILVSAIELPTYLILFLILDACGRRIPLLICFTLAGLACISLALVPQMGPGGSVSILALALLGKAGIAAAFSICYIYAAELFPTKFRSQALGLCSMVGHAGPILSPFIALLGGVDRAIPYLIFGGFGVLAALASPILPETTGSSLPETVHEAEVLGSDARRWRRIRRIGTESGPGDYEDDDALLQQNVAVASAENVAEDEPLLGSSHNSKKI